MDSVENPGLAVVEPVDNSSLAIVVLGPSLLESLSVDVVA